MSITNESENMISSTSHIGRSFGDDHHLEDDCPCPQEPCGLIAVNRIDPECPEHDFRWAKTIRQGHSPANCPPKPRRALVEPTDEQIRAFDQPQIMRYLFEQRALWGHSHKLLEARIERATAALSYFGPQGANIIAILEGTDAPTDL